MMVDAGLSGKTVAEEEAGGNNINTVIYCSYHQLVHNTP